MRIHFNKSNGIFSIRRDDRSTLRSTERNFKLPLVGDIVPLASNVFILVSRGDYQKAITKCRPSADVRVTKWPRVRLFFKRLKELADD